MTKERVWIYENATGTLKVFSTDKAAYDYCIKKIKEDAYYHDLEVEVLKELEESYLAMKEEEKMKIENHSLLFEVEGDFWVMQYPIED